MEHKIIRGGELLLPMARSRIKALRALGLPYASQKFEVPGLGSMHVSIAGDQDYIVLDGAPSAYQFFTTGPELVTTAAGGTPCSKGYSLSATVGKRDDDPAKSYQLKAKPSASSFEQDANEPERWKFLAEPEAITIGEHFPLKMQWQIQGAIAHVHYPKATGDNPLPSGVSPYPFLASSWTHYDPLANAFARGGIRTQKFFEFDIGYDISPGRFARAGISRAKGSNRGTAPDADWYKRAASCRVTHPEFGTRTIVLMTDASSAFHAFAIDETDEAITQNADAGWPGQHIKTNIPGANAKRESAPFPAWARSPTDSSRMLAVNTPDFLTGGFDIGALLDKVPQYRWTFNSDCTRACAVVYEDIAGLPADPPNASVTPLRTAAGEEVAITESLPGLLELDIALALTGPEPGDFSFTLTVRTELQPTVTKRYIMAADYAWNVPAEPVVGAAPDAPPPPNIADLDDLIVLEGEIYHTSDARTSPPQGADPEYTSLSLYCLKALAQVRNETQKQLLRTFVTSHTDLLYTSRYMATPAPFPAGNTAAVGRTHFPPLASGSTAHTMFRATGTLLAFDLRVLAFVVQQRFTEYTPKTNSDFNFVHGWSLPERTGGGTSLTTVQVQVFFNDQLEKTLVMDPDSTLNPKLEAAFADTATESLFKYPVDDVGHAFAQGAYFTAYDKLNLSSTVLDVANGNGPFEIGDSWYASGLGGTRNAFVSGCRFNAGPYLYALCMAPALQAQFQSPFTVHPDGRWSVTTRPIICYSGPSTLSPSENEFDAALMKQDYIDILVLRYFDKEANAWKERRTTHLEALNQAFDKTLTREDFFYTFDAVVETTALTQPIPDTRRRQYLTVSVKGNNAAAGRFLVGSRRSPGSADLILREQPSDIDANSPQLVDFIYQYCPMLRGSSLFY